MENKPGLCAVGGARGQSGVKSGRRSGAEGIEGEMLRTRHSSRSDAKFASQIHQRWMFFSEGGSQESQCSSVSNEYQSRRTDGIR